MSLSIMPYALTSALQKLGEFPQHEESAENLSIRTSCPPHTVAQLSSDAPTLLHWIRITEKGFP